MASSVLQYPPMPDNETCITFCKRCGLRTRHERQRWQRRFSPLSLLTDRVQTVEGWRCTKCGATRKVQARYLPDEPAAGG